MPWPFWEGYKNGSSNHGKALARLRHEFLTKLLVDAGHLHHLVMGTTRGYIRRNHRQDPPNGWKR